MALAAFLAIASVATVMPLGVNERLEEYARILDEVPVRAILMDERPHAPLTRLAEERGLTLLRATAAKRRAGRVPAQRAPPGARSRHAPDTAWMTTRSTR